MASSPDPQPGIKIGEILRQTGVTRATVHHYVREGLLPPPQKLSRNQALYEQDCVDRVLLIKGLQKHQRLSLAEVKEVLREASGHDGLQRLRHVVELEAGAARASRLNPERPRTAVDLEELLERTRLTADAVRSLERLGVVTPVSDGDRVVYAPADVDVAEALGALGSAGFNQAHGFQAEDAVIYLRALRSLLHEEVQLFFERASRSGIDPEEMVRMAEHGVERVTPLILALRRKLIQELIDAMPLPPAA